MYFPHEPTLKLRVHTSYASMVYTYFTKQLNISLNRFRQRDDIRQLPVPRQAPPQ